jgi:hypothetical protein
VATAKIAIDIGESRPNSAATGDQMHINEHAVSFAAFALVKILAAELVRKGVLDQQEFASAISTEIDQQQEPGLPRNEDAATLLSTYLEEMSSAIATNAALTGNSR